MWNNRLRNTKKAIVVELPEPDQSELSNYSSEEDECFKNNVLNEDVSSSSNSDSCSGSEDFYLKPSKNAKTNGATKTNEKTKSKGPTKTSKTAKEFNFSKESDDYVPNFAQSQFLGEKPDYSKFETDSNLPIDYFNHFLKKEMIEHIQNATNNYSIEKTGRSIECTYDEMEQFIGILIHMGVIHMPEIKMYWASNTRYDPIANIMSRNRFYAIKSFFHIAFNQDLVDLHDNQYDKMFKVRQLLDHVLANCQSIEPEEMNSIDEQVIPFKGKSSSLRQYNPKKPKKWGFKVLTRCSTSGLIYNFFVYIGTDTFKHWDTEENQHINEAIEIPKPASTPTVLKGSSFYSIQPTMTPKSSFTLNRLNCTSPERNSPYATRNSTKMSSLTVLKTCNLSNLDDLESDSDDSFKRALFDCISYSLIDGQPNKEDLTSNHPDQSITDNKIQSKSNISITKINKNNDNSINGAKSSTGLEIIETLNSNFNGLNSSSNLFSTPKTNHTNNLELLSFIAINQLQDQMDLVEPLQTEPILAQTLNQDNNQTSPNQNATTSKLIELVPASSKPHEMSISMMTVLRLIKNLPPNKNFKLYFDNWFSSEALTKKLLQLGFHSVSTIRTNRFNCEFESTTKLFEKKSKRLS
jgi:hypothetical protein